MLAKFSPHALFLAALLGAGTAGAATVKAPGPNRESPELVREVLAGKRADANALWWGFNAEDATASLQAAINSGARRLFVPNVGKEWVARPIALASDQEILFERGVVVSAKAGEFRGTGDCLFRSAGGKNISLTGYGAVLRMRKKDYQGPDYQKAEWRHTLSFVSCSRVRVLGLTLRESGGDGIYLGSAGGAQPYCKDVVIRDVLCDGHHRQGISVISAEDLLIERTTMRNTSGTAPMAGIDFEPNGPGERLVNCVMRDCLSEGNAGAAFVLYLAPLAAQSEPVSVTLERCRAKGSGRGQAGFGVSGSRTGGLRGVVRFIDCRSQETNGPAVSVRQGPGDSMAVRFERCLFKSAAPRQPGRAPITITAAPGAPGSTQGAVELVGCAVEDGVGRPFLSASIGGASGAPPLVLRGSVRVRGPFGGRMHLGAGVNAEGLKVTGTRTRPALSMRLRPARPDARIEAPVAGLAVRGSATYLLYARKGEAISLALACRELGKYTDGLSYFLLSPSGKTLAEGDVPPGEKRDVQAEAPETGVCTLACTSGQNAGQVTTANRLSLLVPGEGVSLLQPQGSAYFTVPAGRRSFSLQVRGEGDAELVRAAIVDPSGTALAGKDLISGTSPHRFALERRAARAPQTWSVRFDRPSEGAFEDVVLYGLQGIPGVVSFHPDALLLPE